MLHFVEAATGDKQQYVNFKRTPDIFPFDFGNSEEGASALALQLATLSAQKSHWVRAPV